MKVLNLSIIISKIGGEVVKGSYNKIVNNATIRTQRIRNNTLYFDMYKNAVINLKAISKNKGVVIVTDRPKRFEGIGNNVTIVKVKDAASAYWNFVDFYRSQFNIPVIGVTGTCGKTTTKEMIKYMLSLKYSNIVATFKSRNQRPFNLGYMLEIDDNTQIAAIEMGITWPGDLPIYCRYFKPQIGVITNIGIDHLSDCKTLENYIEEKSKLLLGLENKGTLILNADDENIEKISLSDYKGKVVYFGFNKMADFMGSDLRRVENGIEFTLTHDSKSYKVSVPVLGNVNAYNAIAAIAAVCEVGIGIEEAIEKLNSYKNVEKHLEIRKGIKGCTIIDDTWSSNPTAADAAIRILKDYSEGKKTVVVLGRMPLLGGYTTKFHKELGETIAELGIDYLVTIDEISKNIGLGAQEKGMNANSIYNCNDLNQVMKVLNNLLDENTVVLVKTAMLDSDLYDGFVDKLIVNNI